MRLASALSHCIADGCSAASQECSGSSSRPSADAPDPRQGSRVTVVASTEAVEDVAAPLRRCFTHELRIDAPDKDARLTILEVWLAYFPILPGTHLMHSAAACMAVLHLVTLADHMQDAVHLSSSPADVDLEQIASQAAGMLPSDLMAISADAASSAALQMLGTEVAATLDGNEVSSEAFPQNKAPAGTLRLTPEHYKTGLQNLRQRTAVAIGAPQVRCCIAALAVSVHDSPFVWCPCVMSCTRSWHAALHGHQ